MSSDSARIETRPAFSAQHGGRVFQSQLIPSLSTSPIEPSSVIENSPEEWLVGGGEMGRLIRSIDWSATKLGPVESWSRSLRTMLGVVLGSRFPMLLWWGPDLLHLYNDAYRPILRDKHPASLGAPAAEIWAEVWDVAGPLARSVQQGGPATWTEDLQLFIKNGRMAEETYFTFSYSPVPGDDGRVGGILNTVQETTVKVQSERQIRMLHDLAARATDARSEDQAFRIAAEVLSANELDLPFVLFYLLNEKADRAHLVAASGWKDYHGPAKPTQVPISEQETARWPFLEVIQTHSEVVIDDLAVRFGPLPVGRWNTQPERAIILPLSRVGQVKPYGFFVAGVSPHRVLDERYQRFFQATKDQVASVIANACAYEQERKRAEALSEIDRAKTHFFSNVSHEFRTPLTLMLAPLEDELAERAHPLPATRRERLEAVHRNSLRLLKLVNTLLDFSRIEAGRMEASYEATDLAGYTAALASLFHSATEKASLTLSVDCPPLPEAIYVDREMWEKIVLNLVSNALKHTFHGGIRVALRWVGDHVELSVEDSGVGIPETALPHLFERFQRVKGAKSRTHEGTGIGLALVQELVSLHGGSVHVDSQEGKGSSFMVRIKTGVAHLPFDRIATGRSSASTNTRGTAYVQEALQWLPEAAAQIATKASDSEAALGMSPPTGPVRPRILWADDNADLRAYVNELLVPYYDVEAVADGAAALDAARERTPDLVLSDVMMPRLDGLGLLRELRADPRTRTVPVILLSARAGEEAAVEGLDASADDYLAKPFSARELMARVRTHLDLARIRQKWAKELQEANHELEAFSYSVSHDLRAPLRSILGFSQILLEDHVDRLDGEGMRVLHVISENAVRMGQLIDDLLEFSRVGRQEMKSITVDMTSLTQAVVRDLVAASPGREIQISIGPLPESNGDPALLRQVLVNLIGNSIKYTRNRDVAQISIEGQTGISEEAYSIRDNGVGFEMEYAHKLFGIFQRLHPPEEFEGTGVGLSLAQRIIHRHGGRIWAEGKVDEGATFCFTLPRLGATSDVAE